MKGSTLIVAVLLAALFSEAADAHALALLLVAGVLGLAVHRLQARVEALERQAASGQPRAAEAPVPPVARAPAASDFEPTWPGSEPVGADTAPATLPHLQAPGTASAATAAAATGTVGTGTVGTATTARTATNATNATNASTATAPTATAAEVDDRSTRVTSSIGQSVIAWFRGGNTIVRVGVLILFIGVAFLLRFAAERSLLPVEWRLAGVAAGGAALSVLGWRLRTRRRGYALSLQGAGIGVLYLVIFAALRLYALLPAPLAFGLLVVLAASTALLAVAQDALPLAVLAFGGGFLAPVLTSTGEGSHVALFSYYGVLNVAIAWIASRQAWKLLNLVGFTFTFVIGLAWGLRSYRPELYASTQAFLAAHFALYLWICVQYSRQLVAARDEARLRAVDGGLLFGLPIVAFGLQAGIVRHLPLGLALSAAVLSCVYLLLGRWLWRQAGPALRLLTEGLLALGLIFLVLVTPLALDARWTGAAWAVQGAGIVWIALRQRRGWAAAIGLLLQALAAASFWESAREPGLTPFANAHLLGALLLGASAGTSAWLLRRQPLERAQPWPGGPVLDRHLLHGLHVLMLALGLAQALAGLWQEVDALALPRADAPLRAALLCVVCMFAIEAAHVRLRWPELRWGGRVLLLFAALASGLQVLGQGWSPGAVWRRFSEGLGALELLAVLGAGTWLQRRLDRAAPAAVSPRSTAPEHLVLGWYAVLQGAVQLYAFTAVQVQRHEGWTPLALIVLPVALAWWITRQSARGAWPAAAHPVAWRRGLLWPGLVLLALWWLAADLFADGGMAPLPYLPLLNPIDLGHVAVLLLAWRQQRAGLLPPRVLALGAAALGFVWLDALLVRTLHHWAGTPMWTDGALASGLVQTGLTILWTCLALLTMLFATRRAAPALARRVWLAGALLLGVVVLKLFFVDLSSIGTLERIVSFLGVGLLMLVIGYVSPMPPAAAAAKATA